MDELFHLSGEYISEFIRRQHGTISGKRDVSLEVQENVDSRPGGIRLQKVAHGLVMHRQLTEDLFAVGLELDE